MTDKQLTNLNIQEEKKKMMYALLYGKSLSATLVNGQTPEDWVRVKRLIGADSL